MDREKKKKIIPALFFTVFLLPFLLFVFFLNYPKIKIFEKGVSGQSLRIYDRNGVLLYETLSEEMSKTRWIQPNSIPPLVEGAVISSEDKRFYKHSGIDPLALLRAVWIDLKSFSIKQGGSTITQQTAKLILKRKGRNLILKLYEFFYALKLENQFTKKEILSIYLNLAPYGKNIVGIKKAAEVYFNSPIENLTPAQIAYLSAIPKAPAFYNPSKNYSTTKSRQERILKRMNSLGFLSDEELQTALNEKISIIGNPYPFLAPHFVERVKEEEEGKSEKTILTTIDSALMKKISFIIESKKELLNKIGAANCAVVVLDNKSGEFIAWEGSGNYFSEEKGSQIDGVNTPRQPGSALKPFLYALAFESKKFIPSSALPDIPSSFKTSKEGSYYIPRNYDNKFRGPLSMRKALAGSINVPAVFLIDEVGVANFIRLLRSGGITTIDKTDDYYGAGLALGNAEVKLCELANLYATLARGGVYIKPTKILSEHFYEEKRILSLESSFLVTDILSDNKAREFSFGRRSSLEFPFKVAAKTGTSEGYHDNFAFGYNKDITVGVWVGNFDRKPLKYSSGVSGAGPIFHQVFLEAVRHLRGGEPQPFEEIIETPKSLKKIDLCALSGMEANPNCPSRVKDYVFKEEKIEKCNWHRKIGKKLITIYPEIYQSWAKDMGLIQETQDYAVDFSEYENKKLTIISPMPEAIFLYDPTIPRKYQGIYLEATGATGKIKWIVDGKEFKTAKKGEKVFYEFSKGEHLIEAVDENNNRAFSNITIR